MTRCVASLGLQVGAYADFFEKRADFPRFKKKGQATATATPDLKQIKQDQANSHLFLPKLGWLRYRTVATCWASIPRSSRTP